MHQITLTVETQGREIKDITAEVNTAIKTISCDIGLCHLFIQHTSASLFICENDDPAVRVDLENFMTRLAPDGHSVYTHTAEGPDDMPAHIRSILTDTSLLIPIQQRKLALGRWQSVCLWEHRFGQHKRKVLLSLLI